MLWFLITHIATMLFWCASIFYILAVIGVHHGQGKVLSAPGDRGSIARFIFTNIASPAALLAIAAGTIVFIIDRTTDVWMLAKLSLVTALVIVHALMGMFLVKIDHNPNQPVVVKCICLALVLVCLMTVIITIVLGKPDWGLIA